MFRKASLVFPGPSEIRFDIVASSPRASYRAKGTNLTTLALPESGRFLAFHSRTKRESWMAKNGSVSLWPEHVVKSHPGMSMSCEKAPQATLIN